MLGCAVNGIGEASHADFGITGAKNEGLIFAHGKPLRKVPQADLVDALFEEIDRSLDRGNVEVDARKAAEGAAWLQRIEDENADELTPERIAQMEAAAAKDEDADITAEPPESRPEGPPSTRSPRRSPVGGSPGRLAAVRGEPRVPGRARASSSKRIVAGESVAIALVPEVEEGDGEDPAVERSVGEALAQRPVRQVPPDLGAQQLAPRGPLVSTLLISTNGGGREPPRGRVIAGGERLSWVEGSSPTVGFTLREQRPVDPGVELLQRTGFQQRESDRVVGARRHRGQVGAEDRVGGEGDPRTVRVA